MASWPDAAKTLAASYSLADCAAFVTVLEGAMGVTCDTDLAALGLEGSTPRQLCCATCKMADEAADDPRGAAGRADRDLRRGGQQDGRGRAAARGGQRLQRRGHAPGLADDVEHDRKHADDFGRIIHGGQR